MKKILAIVFAAAVLCFAVIAPAMATVVPLDPAADLGVWQKFYWSGGDGASVNETYTFTLDSEMSLFVTDAYQVGDIFTIYDTTLGEIGSTSYVAPDATPYITPYGDQTLAQSAYDSGIYSTGEFLLGPGSYDISLIVSVSPYGAGGAYLKLDTPTAVPEPATLLLLGTGLAGLAIARRKMK